MNLLMVWLSARMTQKKEKEEAKAFYRAVKFFHRYVSGCIQKYTEIQRDLSGALSH